MAQNNNTSLVVGFSISAVLALGFAVGLYMVSGHSSALENELQASKNKESELNSTVRQLSVQLTDTRGIVALVSSPAKPEAMDPENDVTLVEAKKVLDMLNGDGTSAIPNLIDAVRSTDAESKQHQMAASNRQQQLDVAARNLNDKIATKDKLIEVHRQARDHAEKTLKEQEAKHGELMKGLEDQIRTLTAEKATIDAERGRLETTLRNERLAWSEKREEMLGWLVDMRSKLRAKTELTFSRPDGLITSVDHNEHLAYIDLGKADGLQKGTGFSVYLKNHTGVGKTNSSDIKGKLEVTELLGLHRAKAQIVEMDRDNPIAPNDPIYSPIFGPGQTMEVALVGQINVDGLERAELRRLIRAAGSKISVEVSRQGQFTDGDGNEISREEAVAKVTARTRFLVIGDVGDPNKTSIDARLQAVYQEMRSNKAELEEKCAGLGIYPIGLSAFLEHIGFSPKQRAWSAESGKPFPSTLANGARSSATNTRFGNRESSSVISGLYTDRRKPPMVSTGSVSKKYSGK